MKSIDKKWTLDRIDPQLAWDAWSPSEKEPWDRSRVSLLYRRASFGATADEVSNGLNKTPAQILDELSGRASDQRSVQFESESGEMAKAVLGTSEMKRLVAWWLLRMLHSPTPLVEKLTLFWHGHFATGAEKVQDVELMYQQNQLLRSNALGDFRVLVQGIAKDAAMLIYLDSVSNRKAHANENFARELMELFCLGEGNYSEADVQQLAKCFTGWEIRRKQFRFNSYQHDDSLKTLLGVSGIESGERAIDTVVDNPSMAPFIARKLFRFFVSEELHPTDAFLEPLSKKFTESNCAIEPVVRMILESRLMLSGWSIGRKIRSPVELVIGWMRTMQCTSNMTFLADRLRTIGQSVLFPPNVKGWEGGRAWINSSTLIGRANLIYELVRNENTRFGGEPLASFMSNKSIKDSRQLMDWFSDLFIAEQPSAPELAKVASAVSSEAADKWGLATLSHLAGLPRIHLS